MNAIKNRKFYFIRAMYEWCVNSDLTPFIVADLRINQITVPPKLKDAEDAIFNIGPIACSEVDITNKFIFFSTRFQGVNYDMCIPLESITAIFPQELGPQEGIGFISEKKLGEQFDPPPEPSTSTPDQSKEKKRGHLTLVK
ncbi:MAG: ClpXP protease specificity-enhancing factor SspB [Candidatus Nitrosotenuis sp.]